MISPPGFRRVLPFFLRDSSTFSLYPPATASMTSSPHSRYCGPEHLRWIPLLLTSPLPSSCDCSGSKSSCCPSQQRLTPCLVSGVFLKVPAGEGSDRRRGRRGRARGGGRVERERGGEAGKREKENKKETACRSGDVMCREKKRKKQRCTQQSVGVPLCLIRLRLLQCCLSLIGSYITVSPESITICAGTAVCSSFSLQLPPQLSANTEPAFSPTGADKQGPPLCP